MRRSVKSGIVVTIYLCLLSICVGVLPAQTKQSKPLLIVRVESEKINVTQPSVVTTPSAFEVKELQDTLKNELSQIFEIIPETDKRDCLELSVVLEKVKTNGVILYVGSSAIAVGKGENDLLYTHNPFVQPTIKKVSSALVFQLSTMQIQAILGKL